MSEWVTLKISKDPRIVKAKMSDLERESGYFRAMLYSTSFSDIKHRPIDLGLKDLITFETLKEIVDYVGTGTIKLTRDSLKSLIAATDFFEMDRLISVIVSQITNDFTRQLVDVENVLDLWLVTKDTKDITIGLALGKFIRNHFEAIMYESSFFKLDLESVVWIMESDYLRLSSEKEAFYAIKMWVDYDFLSRNKEFVRLLGCVRYDDRVDDQFLEENVRSYCNCVASEDYLLQYSELHDEPYLVVGINTQPRVGSADDYDDYGDCSDSSEYYDSDDYMMSYGSHEWYGSDYSPTGFLSEMAFRPESDYELSADDFTDLEEDSESDEDMSL